MNNHQTIGMEFYQQLQDAVAKWAAETKPEDCRIVGGRVVGKTFLDLQAAIAQVCITHQVRSTLGTLIMLTATASLIACYGRMDPDKFLSDLTEILSIGMSVAYNAERNWLSGGGEADRAAQDGGETPTVH